MAAEKDYHLEGWQHFFQPEEDRAAAEKWKLKSKCLDTPRLDEFFFPDPEDPNARNLTKKGKRFCLGTLDPDDKEPCAALKPCLEYAMENRIWEGVFGGTSGRERRKLATERNKQTNSASSSKTKTSATSLSPTSVAISKRKTPPTTKTETPPTSTPVRSARATGAPAARGTASRG